MKSITIGELVKALKKLNQNAEIGINDSDTEWYVPIVSISKTAIYKGDEPAEVDKYIINSNNYWEHSIHYMDEEVVNFEESGE